MNEHFDSQRPFGRRPDGGLTISFFSAPAHALSREIVEWGSEVRRKVTPYYPLPGTWTEFLGEYITPNTSIVIVPTRSEWCAYIGNDRIGGMPDSELVVIPERLHTRSISFAIGDLHRCKKENRPYAAMFRYYDATRREIVQRSVEVLWDGGRWEFHEYGAALPFEEADAYKSRRKGDRLTPEMLVRYARTLGIRLDEGDSFYKLDQAIGLKWHWLKAASFEEEIAPIKHIAEQVNKELDVNWKLNIFGK
jgi:hypothetical protein